MDRPLGPLIRGATAALLLGALLGLPGVDLPGVDLPGLVAPAAAATPAAATPAADPPRTPGTGTHRTTLPQVDAAPRVFRVERTSPGSTFHVGLWFVGAGDSVGEGGRVSIGTTPGAEDCGTGAVFRPTVGEPAPLLTAATSTWTDDPAHRCATAPELFVALDAPSDPVDAGRPARLLVFEEPPLSAYALSLLSAPTPPPPPPPSTPAPVVDARPVSAGSTPADAPVLGDGSHTLTIAPGRAAVVAVPLDWDQTLDVRLDTDGLDVQVLGPLLGPSGTADAGRARSRTVSYLDRESYDAPARSAALAGVHLVVITWPRGDDADDPIGTTLTVTTSGTPGDGVPAYTRVEGLPAPRADSRLVDGSLRAATDRPHAGDADAGPDGDGDRTSLLVGGGVAFAVAVLLVAVRRMRATRRAGRARGR